MRAAAAASASGFGAASGQLGAAISSACHVCREPGHGEIGKKSEIFVTPLDFFPLETVSELQPSDCDFLAKSFSTFAKEHSALLHSLHGTLTLLLSIYLSITASLSHHTLLPRLLSVLPKSTDQLHSVSQNRNRWPFVAPLPPDHHSHR